MALTTDEWYERLKRFVPSWRFCKDAAGNDPEKISALFFGMAAGISALEQAIEDHQRETFICEAVDGYLDEHGSERNVERVDGETNFSYAQRIKNIINTTSCPEIKRVVDALLDVGEATIIEDGIDNSFLNREAFFNRGNVMIEDIENTFSIIVDNQVHEPYSFYDREYFLNREDFAGTNESSFELFQLIVQTVNANKACGTAYRLIERAG